MLDCNRYADLLCLTSEQYNEKHSNVKDKIEKDEQH